MASSRGSGTDDARRPAVTWEPPKQEAGAGPGRQVAGYGARLVAFVLDAFIVNFAWLALTSASFVLWAAERGRGPGGVISGLVFLLGGVWLLAYFPFFWRWSGRTSGMRLFNLLVVRDADGERVSSGQAVLRLIGLGVASIPLGLGFIWMFVDSRRRGWHDLIAGTIVIKRPSS